MVAAYCAVCADAEFGGSFFAAHQAGGLN